MKTPVLQKDIVAHLRALGRPESSRALAARFLRIEHGDEETCRRLLAPFFATVPGIRHDPGTGWSLAAGPSTREAESPERPSVPDAPRSDEQASTLRDYVALASEGAGPGGSGTPVRVSLLPVLAGEPCQEESFPDSEADWEVPTEATREQPLTPAVLEEIVQTIGELPVVCHRIGREVEPLRRLCAEAGIVWTAPVISAAKLGRILLGLKPSHATVDLARELGLETRGPDDSRGRSRLIAAVFLSLTPRLQRIGIDSLESLLEYQDMPAPPLDLSPYSFTVEDLKALPATPGVYRFLDRDDQVIYVGKAKNLRVRVGSYFTPAARGTAKGRAVLEQVRSIRFDRVASELEANLLEASQIAEHRPRLNRQFDVHERPRPYGPRLNLVVVLKDDDPAAVAPRCTVHLLREGRYLGNVRGVSTGPTSGEETWREVGVSISNVYFPGSAPTPGSAGVKTAEEIDIDWQLVGSFVRKYRDEVNVLDMDECASPEDALKRLRALVQAAIADRGRIVAR